ncbi:C4-dicarboxylate transport sensor protein [Burkholderia pseudomallei]|uniref:sensor histidine kinase n=1 Tax=Burkholderia pseudomallei TaxID=28450 RepID=UPI000F0471F1|nr:ATP-binding protein [Burkholderia pseudomallei]CAJ9736365.1 C4-dicarboxylate transport sensor protein [Burkholderia pseudomallei]VBD56356.1 C4-dicarboxylate transport sensor protein [Burkholderia pseudomallei]VCO34205.1 C4-dicarboxylate transport sensor protein [Burkholderia pseudomallei]VCO52304.1 C4-dicarboxylate transport sensor protein [Burkholderia pseudomallei]
MRLRGIRRLHRTAAVLAVIACCVATAWLGYSVALRYYFRAHMNEVAQRSSLYALTLESQLARYESIPRIAALEPVLSRLLNDPGERALRDEANAYLNAVQKNAELSAAYVMNARGETLAASNSNEPGSFIGSNYAFRPYFADAMKRGFGRFYGVGNTTGQAGYFLAVPIRHPGQPARAPIGVVAIKASLDRYEAALTKSGDVVLLVDRDGVAFLSSVASWRYRTLTPIPAATLRKLAATRQYGDAALEPLSDTPPAPAGAGRSSTQADSAPTPESLHLSLSGGRPAWYHVVYRAAGPLGWRVAVLVDSTDDERRALFASGGVAAATALVFALIMVAWLRHSREKERQRARTALLAAQRDLERRIAERTAELTAANAALEEKVDALDAARRILRDTRDTAIQAGKLAALGQMAAGITHELNQPLAAIMTLSSNAVRMAALGRSADLTRNLELVNDLAGRMGKIVAHMKGFARHESVSREAVSISEALQQALTLIEAHRKAAKVSVRVEPVPGQGIVLASSIRIEQLLVNLLTNAIDASAAGMDNRQVVVTTDVAGDIVRISVADSGKGIPADVMPRLFEPFFTTKQTGKGLGLGLAISQAIVDEFGGRLHARNGSGVEPELGGAVFIVELHRVSRKFSSHDERR